MDYLSPPTFHSGTKRLEGKLWGIAGYFYQPGVLDSMPFGGYFFLDSFLGQEIIFGRLIDGLGTSTIVEGDISIENYLSFDKKYDQSNPILIHYDFEKKDDIWVGSYKMKTLQGRANCVIQPLT